VSDAVATPVKSNYKATIDLAEHQFLPEHVRYLKERGIPLEYAQRAGVESHKALSDLRLKALRERFSGLSLYPHSSFLLFPYKSSDGQDFARVRWDEPYYWDGDEGQETKKPIPRYTGQRKAPVIPYFTPETRLTSIRTDPTIHLFIAEAPAKALSLSAAGFPCIGMGGVEAGSHDTSEWKTKRHLEMNAELDLVCWDRRGCFIAFDAGIQNNPAVAIGAARLAHVLRGRGAKVRLVIIPMWRHRPPMPDGVVLTEEQDLATLVRYDEQDQGPDDFIVRMGVDAFRALVAAAVEADPVERCRSVLAAGQTKDEKRTAIGSLLNDMSWLGGLRVEGKACVDEVLELIKPTGFKRASLREKLAGLDRRIDVPDKPEQSSYRVDQGRICRVLVAEGGEVLEPLCNFSAVISEEVTVDDGDRRIPTFTISGKIGEQALPDLSVASAKYDSMEWYSGWGARCSIEAGRKNREHLAVAIKRLSQPSYSIQYRHTGWRAIEGKQVFLMPGRSIGADDLVCRIKVDGYGFTAKPSGDLKAAIRHSMGLVGCADKHLSYPLLAACYAAPLRPVLPMAFSIVVVGRTAIGKSGFVSEVLSHWGDFGWDRLPVSAKATRGGIEMCKYQVKDCPLVIDNFVPGSTPTEQRRQLEWLQDTLLSTGDQSSKKALIKDGLGDFELRDARPSRCLSILTAEDLPEGLTESAVGRTMVIEARKGEIQIAAMQARFADRGKLQESMMGYLSWLAPKIATPEFATWVQERRRELSDQSLAAMLKGDIRGTDRNASNMATLAVGLDCFLQFGQEHGAFTEDEVQQCKHACKISMMKSCHTQIQEHQLSRTPAERWVEALQACLRGGKASLAKQTIIPLSDAGMIGCPAIGWQDRDHILLDEKICWDAVVDSLGGPDRFPFSRRQTYKQMAESGILELGKDRWSTERSRFTQRRRLGGGGAQVPVLVIAKSKFESVHFGTVPHDLSAEDLDEAMLKIN
jgi:hypothetical protein